jgi:hypothetical protein
MGCVGSRLVASKENAMSSRRFSAVSFSALICLAITSPGCSSDSVDTSAAGPSQPGPGGVPAHVPQGETPPSQSAPTVAIELSEPDAELVLKFIRNSQGQEVPIRVVRWKVKYRFAQGKPQPGMWYTCNAQMGSVAQIEGSQLATEGVFQQETGLFPKSDPPKRVEFDVRDGERKGTLRRKVSNTVSCDVESKLPEDTAKPIP